MKNYQGDYDKVLNFTVSLESMWIYFFASILGAIIAGLVFMAIESTLEANRMNIRKKLRA